MKTDLKDDLALMLLKKGFIVTHTTGACDVLARKDSKILLVKVVEDANSVAPQSIHELKKTAAMLNASPVLISEKATKKLQDNVVYSRHQLDTINLETFKNILSEKPVFIRSKKAGLSAHIKGESIKKVRERQELSLHRCAKLFGVSPSMIRRYEQDDAELSIQRAFRIYERIGSDIFEHITLDRPQEEFYHPRSLVGKKYEILGFNSTETKRQPFDIIAKKEKEIILTRVGEDIKKGFEDISSLLGSRNLIIFERKRPRDFPALKKDEFLDVEDSDELLKFIREFA